MGVTQSFPMATGSNCGANFFGFCSDKWGAFTYAPTKVGTYEPSKVQQEICDHAGYVGDEIQWSIQENGVDVADGTTVLNYRNTVLVNSAGALEDLHFFGTQLAYLNVEGDSIGALITDIINEPELYGGYKVPVKGWNGEEFEDADVQSSYVAWMEAGEESKDPTELQAVYLATYYPDLPQL